MAHPPAPLILLIAVGLTPRHLTDEAFASATPNLRQLANAGKFAPITGITPGVTLAAQATILTGKLPGEHGIVGNGWHFRDTDEIRLWQQSRNLIAGPLLYETARDIARQRGREFSVAKLFAWFNQASHVEYAITPKPWYGADGSKVFGVHGKPQAFVTDLESRIGPFPFHTFWGPMAGSPATEWIGECTAITLREKQPAFTLVYLPNLDYDLQRHGPTGDHVAPALKTLDAAVGQIQAAAREVGARIAVVSEYGITAVNRTVALNRALRKAGFLLVRDGPFGEMIDVPDTPAVAVADHQIAHISVRNPAQMAEVAALVREVDGVAKVFVGEERAEIGLNHPRAGDIVALAQPDTWFSYYYWLDPRKAPDFAPTVDIHRKPGYDPLEMFFAPELPAPKFRVLRKLLWRRLGFRTLLDVIAVDHPTLIHGSHGLLAADPADGPLVLSSDAKLAANLPATLAGVHDWLLPALTGDDDSAT